MIEIQGRSSKDVFSLRKTGKLKDAIELARGLFKVDSSDEWIIRAYAWTLISLIWEHRENPEVTKYVRELNNLPSIEDELLAEKRKTAISIADPISREISQVIQISKDGNHTKALEMVRALRTKHGQHPEIDKTFGWELWHAIRNEMYGDGDPDIERLHRYFHDYGHLEVEKPSDIHSRMLDLAARVASNNALDSFFGFLKWWDPQNIRNEDFSRSPKPEGGHYDSMVEHVIKALGHVAKKENNREHLELAADFISKYYLRFPDMEWFPYYLSIIWNRIDRQSEAIELLLPIVRKKTSEFWAWHHLADCFKEQDPGRLACLCRAVQCPVKEEGFLSNVHLDLANELINAGHKDVAKHHIETVKRIREENGWSLHGRLEEMLNYPWMQNTEAMSDQALLSSLAETTDTILLGNLPSYKAVVGVPKKILGKKGNEFAIVDYLTEQDSLNSTLVLRKKFPLVKDLIKGSPLEIILDEDGERPMVVGVSEREADLFDIFPRINGIVSNINQQKSTTVIKLEDKNKAFMYFDEMDDPSILKEGLFVNCCVANDQGRNRVRDFNIVDGLADSAAWKRFEGIFKEREQGGGHVDGIFITPQLATEISNGQDVVGLAVSKGGDRGDWWSALRILEIGSAK
jgi:hypothetical protein